MGTKELVKRGELSIEEALLLVPEGTRTYRWLIHTAATRVQAKVSERDADKKGRRRKRRRRRKGNESNS